MKRLCSLIVLLVCCTFLCFSLDLHNGRIRLVLHKNMGRFSLYYLSNPEKKKYTSFLLDQDVRTTTLSIVVNNKVYRLGDTGSFKEKIEETSVGARFIWKSKQLEIIEDFVFTTSSNVSETDGITVTLTIANISDAELEVGVRYLFDTYLGESKNYHFKTNTIEKIENETMFEKKNMIQYWISPLPKSDPPVGFQVVTGGSGITQPDKIIFANWKRLNDTPWTYSESSSRNFNLRPYSINDSAVCHYYYPKKLSPGSRMRITILMLNYNESSTAYFAETQEKDVKEILEEASSTSSSPTTIEKTEDTITSSSLSDQIIADIDTLEFLLKMIDERIKTKDISDKDLSTMEKILFEIKEHIMAIMKSY
jgi:hypothetical protein